MIKLFGLIKVILVLGFNFFVIFSFFESVEIAVIAVGVITIYVILGGYLELLKVRAVNSKKLPIYQKNRLESAKNQLVDDVKSTSGINISGVRLYLVPENDMNATAYGNNCISLTSGLLDNVDPITLNSVIAHEISHIINFDAEFKRAVFSSVTLLIAAISVMSFSTMAIVFLIFLVLSFFRSWLGVLAFRGISSAIGGIFGLLQRVIVLIYRSFLSLASRFSEYRCDKFSYTLGYGVQLLHFLSTIDSPSQRQQTLSWAIYSSHPPTIKRIARLERSLLSQKNAEIA